MDFFEMGLVSVMCTYQSHCIIWDPLQGVPDLMRIPYASVEIPVGKSLFLFPGSAPKLLGFFLGLLGIQPLAGIREPLLSMLEPEVESVSIA